VATGRGEPAAAGSPRAAGVPRPPGSLIPSERHKPMTATDKMAADKSFARMVGVKPKKLRKQLPRVLG
jgi:hypothetical protein